MQQNDTKNVIQSKMTVKKIKGCCIIFLLLFSFYCNAQIELSTGFDLSYPVLMNSDNKALNAGQITFGVRAGIAYKPAETQFFPILNLSYGRTRLPLQQFGENVAALNFNYADVMLNENYIVTFPKSQLFIYGGIGFSYLQERGITVAGTGGEAMQPSIDSTKNISKAFPALNVGFEYNYGESTGKDLYLTIGINFQYMLLLQDRNTYYIDVVQQRSKILTFTSNLTGSVIAPDFYIAIHYKMHKKRSSSMYL